MDPVRIIEKHAASESEAFAIILEHGRMVAAKALSIAERVSHLSPDITFIREAAMLHDIGIIKVDAPQIGCHGKLPYICHGIVGREILDREGLPAHGLVCERHIGTGIEVGDIEKYGLPLPRRDMSPRSIEEKIICYADKFYSKNRGRLGQEKSVGQIRAELEKFGSPKVQAFDALHQLFSR